MAKAKAEEVWFAEVARIMARQGESFRKAAAQLGKALSPEEADNLQRREAFEKILQHEKLLYWQELGENPERSKIALVGMLFDSMQQLHRAGEHSAVVDAGLKLYKVEFGAETPTVNVLGNLTQADLDELKLKLLKIQQAKDETPKPTEMN